MAIMNQFVLYANVITVNIKSKFNFQFSVFFSLQMLKNSFWTNAVGFLIRFHSIEEYCLHFYLLPKILQFFILNTIYLLKVTTFLGKISQFEFLVMTEKNICAYKLFLSLNILDFNLFFMLKLQSHSEKVTASFPATSL